MNNLKLHLGLIVVVFALQACGIVSGSSVNSRGSETIGLDASVASFDASLGQEVFSSVPVKNTTSNTITLYKVTFVNNPCNAFSYYGLSDTNGNFLLGPADNVNFTFKSDDRIQVLIRFKPEACAVTNYDTTVYLSFRDLQNKVFSSAVVLHSSNESPNSSSGEVVNCDNVPAVDDTKLKEDRRFGIPSVGNHYLRVDGMRAFIFPPESEANMIVIGTDIGEVDPNDFIKPYLTIEVKNRTATSADLTLKQISECDEFSIPSALSDPFFLGSPTLLTTDLNYDGKIELKNTNTGFKEINLSIPKFRVRLLAENVGDATPQNDSSIIVDSITKTFQIGVTMDLTTKTSVPDTVLVEKFPQVTNATDPNGDFVLSLTPEVSKKRALQGEPLIDSQLQIVAKGTFDNQGNDFIGDIGTAKQFLIDKTAYLYVQINATLMCSTEEGGC